MLTVHFHARDYEAKLLIFPSTHSEKEEKKLGRGVISGYYGFTFMVFGFCEWTGLIPAPKRKYVVHSIIEGSLTYEANEYIEIMSVY